MQQHNMICINYNFLNKNVSMIYCKNIQNRFKYGIYSRNISRSILTEMTTALFLACEDIEQSQPLLAQYISLSFSVMSSLRTTASLIVTMCQKHVSSLECLSTASEHPQHTITHITLTLPRDLTRTAVVLSGI